MFKFKFVSIEGHNYTVWKNDKKNNHESCFSIIFEITFSHISFDSVWLMQLFESGFFLEYYSFFKHLLTNFFITMLVRNSIDDLITNTFKIEK